MAINKAQLEIARRQAARSSAETGRNYLVTQKLNGCLQARSLPVWLDVAQTTEIVKESYWRGKLVNTYWKIPYIHEAKGKEVKVPQQISESNAYIKAFWCNEGTSDKVYILAIVSNDEGYQVQGWAGPRKGSKQLTLYDKGMYDLLINAVNVWKSLFDERTKKSYVPIELTEELIGKMNCNKVVTRLPSSGQSYPPAPFNSQKTPPKPKNVSLMPLKPLFTTPAAKSTPPPEPITPTPPPVKGPARATRSLIL